MRISVSYPGFPEPENLGFFADFWNPNLGFERSRNPGCRGLKITKKIHLNAWLQLLK